MYSYHGRIRQRIKNGELRGIIKGDGEFAIILLFNTCPFTRPIRERALYRYEAELSAYPDLRQNESPKDADKVDAPKDGDNG